MTRTTRSDATGNAFESRGRFFARPSLGGGKRKAVLLPHATDQVAADKRGAFIARLVGQIRRAGKAPLVDLEKIVEEAAAATDEQLKDLASLVDGLCEGKETPTGRGVGRGGVTSSTTIEQLANSWTSGELHRLYPDYVKEKSSVDDDIQRLDKWVLPRVKDVRAVDFTLDHALDVMRNLPEKMRPATRRHVAQLMSRLLRLAVFPCRIITASPLPFGFMPTKGTPRVTAVLYPDEDATLLAAPSDKVPLCYRVLFGFLDREGCRTSEAANLTWSDLDLKNGVLTLDRNKTRRPREWPMHKGVTRALAAWKAIRNGKPTDNVFVDADGNPFEEASLGKLAETFRDCLAAAGVTRPQLTEKSAERSPIRAHDLRGTFVSLALANNKTERWVMRRTGHTTSAMVSRYAKHFENAAELKLGRLRALDRAIPELVDVAAKNRLGGSRTRDEERPTDEIESTSTHLAEVAEWQTRRIQKTSDDKPTVTERLQNKPIGDSDQGTPRPLGTAAATSLPPGFDPVAKAIADGQYDVARALLAEMKRAAEERAGNVLPLGGRRARKDRGS